MKNFLMTGLAAMLILFSVQSVVAQCTNANLYPSATQVLVNDDVLDQISTCNYLEEYSNISGVVSGNTYEFTVVGGYITIWQDGAAIGMGMSPLSVTPATSGDIEAHWTVDAACTTASSCVITTMQCTSCTPPVLPACSSNETSMISAEWCGEVALSWDASVDATSYKVSVGSAAGLDDIVAITDVGNILSVNLTGAAASTDHYWTVTPTSGAGDAVGCTEYMFTTDDQSTCWCKPNYTNLTDDWIANVKFKTIDNASGSTGFEDFTAMSANVWLGHSYPMTVDVGQGATGYDQHVVVYVDWDQNGMFDEDSINLGMCNASGGCSVTGMIPVPANAATGMTRMRIIEQYNNPAPDPCANTISYGETEDYMLNVATGCATVTNIGHTLHAPAKCVITWDDAPGATWNMIFYRVKGTSAWTHQASYADGTEGLHYLAQNTVYQYRIASTCDGSFDPWTASPIREFNTASIPASKEVQDATVMGISNLSPNPASDFVRIDYTIPTLSDVSLSVVDMTGRVIFEKTINDVEGFQNETIDVSNFGKGYFMLVLQSGEDRIVKKFATIK